MSWLRNTSFSFARQLSRSLDPRHDYEPQACYNSFCKHWQQAHDIILKSQPSHLHDDVLSVVNHLEQLTTLVVLEARAREINNGNTSCLEFLLSENLLDKLYEWGVCTGKYENAVRLEELKLFGSLVSHYGSQVIVAEPFIRPLLKLLSGFRNELSPENLENQLIKVLSQLCVSLMQNMKFIDLFFLTNHTQNGSQSEFIILRLLLPSVHRDGGVGSAARDALLLCAKMSAKSPQLAQCLLNSNTSVVLATGLSGLYSLLPRTLGDKVYRLTADDVNHVNKLTLFIDSLEFCNAVAEVAHPDLKKQLLDLLYQGFLVPVIGPALLQTKPAPLQSGALEQSAAVTYLELTIRCVTQRGLMRAVLHFLFVYEYDGVKVIDVLINRLEGNAQLSLVSLALMETLIDLNCEDVMIELVYKYLLNGHHLTVAHRHKISDPETYRDAATAFLSLTPKCCSWPIENTRRWVDDLALHGKRILDYKKEDERKINGVNGDIAMSNLVQEIRFNYGNPNETLYGNYHAYLCDARFEIVTRTIACSNWSTKYNTIAQKQEANNNSQQKDIYTKEQDEIIQSNTKEQDGIIQGNTKEQDAIIQGNTKEQDSLISICTSGYDTLKTSVTSEKEPQSLTSLNEDGKILSEEHDSLTSLVEDNIDDESFIEEDGFVEDLFRNSIVKTNEVIKYSTDVPTVKSWRASADTIIGPLLSSLLKKAAAILESDVTVNFRVTSVLSKLATLPTCLLSSLLLCPSFVLPPNVPSLYQILVKLRDEVDQLTDELDNPHDLVDEARVFLIQREMALVKTRAPTSDEGVGILQDSPAHRQDASFKRVENKRRSFSSSISNMFGRRLSSSALPHITQNSPITYNPSTQKRTNFTQEEYWNQSITLRSILNAVILDEWFKELAAICEEHALRLAAENYEDNAYIKTVAL